jgi:hypothetical protein
MKYSDDSTPAVQLGDNGDNAALVQQARNAAGGFDYGSDRAIGSPPNWASQQSDQLYRGATQNNDPASAETTGQVWKSHGDELHQAANDLYNAVSELGNAWIGQGAGAAQGSLIGIANASKQAGDAAHSMASRLAQQAFAAAEVKKMPAPKDFDPARQTAAMLAGGLATMVADMKQQSDEANAVHAQQVQYFNAYTQTMSEVDDTTPSFGPDSLGLPASGRIDATHALPVGGASGVTGAHILGALGPIATGQGGNAGARGGGYGAPAVGFGAAGQPGVAGSAMPTVADRASTGATPGPSSAAGGGSALGIGLGVAGVGLGAVAGKAVLGRGNKSGAKREDADTTGAASTQNVEQQHGQEPARNQSLMNNSGTIGAPQNTPPGGGMDGMHGGEREEDKEHNRAPFLIEADPDAAFGANMATPPPVIGTWDDED